jgi:hypothetical protein
MQIAIQRNRACMRTDGDEQRFLPNLQEDKPVFVGAGRTIGGFRRSSSGSRSSSLVIAQNCDLWGLGL